MTEIKNTIRSANSSKEAIKFFKFAKKGQKLPSDHLRNENYYRKQFALAPDLLLASFIDDQLIGVILAGLEINQILIGEFYVDSKYRKRGIGSQLLQQIEINALKHGVHYIYLGADPKSEGFYLKNNYKPELFIQFQGKDSKNWMDDLTEKYQDLFVIWRQNNLDSSKMIIKTDGLDKKLQLNINKSYPKANTVYLFNKKL